MGIAQRLLLAVLGTSIAGFAWWGGWEIAQHTPSAPQAALGALAFAVIGVVAFSATVLGATARRG